MDKPAAQDPRGRERENKTPTAVCFPARVTERLVLFGIFFLGF